MQRLVHIPDEFEIWSASLAQPSDFRSPFAGDEYNLLLIAGHSDWSEQQRKSFARMLISGNCRFMIAVGPDAKSWETLVNLTGIFEVEDADQDVLTAAAKDVEETVVMSLQAYGSGTVVRVLILGIGHCITLKDDVLSEVTRQMGEPSLRQTNRWISRTLGHIRKSQSSDDT